MYRWLCPLLVCLAACSPAPKAAPEAKSDAAPTKILNFYASPPEIHKGEDALLCYGVEGTGWVKIDPPVEQLSPALSRCFQVKPDATTQYTLSVEGSSQKVDLKVLPARPQPKELIRFFVASPHEVSAGEKVTICYGVKDTKSVKLEPSTQPHPPSEKLCLTETVNTTTMFRLTAQGNDGSTQTTSFTVKVK